MAKLHPRLEARWHALGHDAHRKLFDRLMTISVPFWWHGPTPDDPVIYGGFPGNMRHSDLIKATFSLDSITGLVSQVTDQNLVIEVGYQRLTDADGPRGNIVSTDPAGTSGGPVCRITDAPGLEI